LVDSGAAEGVIKEVRRRSVLEVTQRGKTKLALCTKLVKAIGQRCKGEQFAAPGQLPVLSASSAQELILPAQSEPTPGVAMELQRRLGLSDMKAMELIERLRHLPPDEILRRANVLQAPHMQQALPVTPVRWARPPTARGELSVALRAEPGRARGSACLAIQCPPSPKLESRAWFPGFEACSSEPSNQASRFLTMVDICQFKCVSTKAWAASKVVMYRHMRNFEYKLGMLAAEPKRTRGGRVLHLCQQQRILRFLTQQTLLDSFVSLDLKLVPRPVLESADLQKHLRRTTRLKHVTLPTNGWSTPAYRRHFINALPPTATLTLAP